MPGWPADPTGLQRPLYVQANAELATIAANLLFAQGANPPLALAELNQTMPGKVNGGLDLTIGDVTVTTQAGDSFAAVCTRTGKPIGDFVTAVQNDPAVLAQSGLLAGQAPLELVDAARPFGVTALGAARRECRHAGAAGARRGAARCSRRHRRRDHRAARHPRLAAVPLHPSGHCQFDRPALACQSHGGLPQRRREPAASPCRRGAQRRSRHAGQPVVVRADLRGSRLLSIQLGTPTAPLPLRAYPPVAVLLNQTALPPQHPTTVADAVKWSYASALRHQSAEQNRIQLTVNLNTPNLLRG